MAIIDKIKAKAAADVKCIVLPEGEEERNVQAAAKIAKAGLAKVIMLGDPAKVKAVAEKFDVCLCGVEIINPATSEKAAAYAEKLYELRKAKGMTEEQAAKLVADPMYYGVMMVKMGDADGLVSGAIHSTGDMLRPALQIIKAKPGMKTVSSCFLMESTETEYGDNGIMIFADCAVNIDPDAEQLANIALGAADSARSLAGIEPRVAMLSFSTKGSAKHDNVTKVQEATRIAREMAPELMLDGELQLAVQHQLGSHFTRNAGGFLNLGHVVMLGAALSGEAQHSHARLNAGQAARRIRRTQSNVGQLLGIGIDVNGAVGKDHDAVVAVFGLGGLHQEAGRNGLHAGLGLDDLKRRAQHIAGRMDRAGNQAVGIAHLDHHHAVVHRIGHQLGRLLLRHALGLAQLIQLLGIGRRLLGRRGVNDFHAAQAHIELFCHSLDLGRVAQHDHLGQTGLGNLRSRLNVTLLFALGQHDALHIGRSLRLDLVNNRHDISLQIQIIRFLRNRSPVKKGFSV